MGTTEPGPATGSATVAGRRARELLGSSATAWAAQLATELATELQARNPDLTAPVDDIAAQSEILILRTLAELVGADEMDGVADLAGKTDDLIRHLIEIEVPFARVSEGVRLTHESVVRALLGVAIAREASAATLTAITLAVTRSMDDVLDAMAARYLAESQRFSTSVQRGQQELIDMLIGGNAVDAREVSTGLGLAIDEHHLGFVISRDTSSTQLSRHVLWRPVDVVQHALGVSRVLVRENEGAVWVWATARHPPDVDEARLAAEIGDTVRVGVGSVQPGAAGFRRTHLEAVAANRSRVGGAAGLVCYPRHALTVLLSADPERSRWFVEQELGELVVPSPRNRELLATLRCYLDSRLRVAVAAVRLHVHRNTVLHRLGAIETILGHPLTERLTEVQSALSIIEHVDGGGPSRP